MVTVSIMKLKIIIFITCGHVLTRAFRTSIYQRSIGVAGPCMWDSLPSNFKDINCLSLFKRNLTLYVCFFMFRFIVFFVYYLIFILV